jgi:hypothetical protein
MVSIIIALQWKPAKPRIIWHIIASLMYQTIVTMNA